MTMGKLLGTICILGSLVCAGCQGDSEDKGGSPSATSPKPQAAPLVLDTQPAGHAARVTAKGKVLDLGGSHEHAMIARRNADGSVTTECHDDQQTAEAALAAPVAARAVVQEVQ